MILTRICDSCGLPGLWLVFSCCHCGPCLRLAIVIHFRCTFNLCTNAWMRRAMFVLGRSLKSTSCDEPQPRPVKVAAQQLCNNHHDEPKPPHAIPCGHIFCKEFVRSITCTIGIHPRFPSCLHTVKLKNCPLCRKPFLPERAKKLITGSPGGSTVDVEEAELLKRLATSWHLQEEQLLQVTTDVETWLHGRRDVVSVCDSGDRTETHRSNFKYIRPSFPCSKPGTLCAHTRN